MEFRYLNDSQVRGVLNKMRKLHEVLSLHGGPKVGIPDVTVDPSERAAVRHRDDAALEHLNNVCNEAKETARMTICGSADEEDSTQNQNQTQNLGRQAETNLATSRASGQDDVSHPRETAQEPGDADNKARKRHSGTLSSHPCASLDSHDH